MAGESLMSRLDCGILSVNLESRISLNLAKNLNIFLTFLKIQNPCRKDK